MSLDNQYDQAANIINEATYLLIAAGAGMSADSQMLVFAQVSSLPALKEKNLSYDQVACLNSLCFQPDLFYGFWLNSMVTYDNAQLHEGYGILKQWNEKKEKSNVGGIQPVFVVTTNVDGFFLREGFEAGVVSQIHGSLNNWQCGGIPSGKKFPLFEANRCCDELQSPPIDVEIDRNTLELQRINGELPNSLKCPRCRRGLLRPNVYLFGDGEHFVNNEEVTRTKTYFEWVENIKKDLKVNPHHKLCIIEIGCGLRVPSIRTRSEELVLALGRESCSLIRINPDYPISPLKTEPTIGIKQSALRALIEINKKMKAQ